MKNNKKYLIILFSLLFLCGCQNKTDIVHNNKIIAIKPQQKIYTIPSELRKENYSVEDFKRLYIEYLKLNKVDLETSTESKETEISNEGKLGFNIIYDITPKEVKEEIGCQIFKVKNSYEHYVLYKSKIFHIGFGFGGYGVVSLKTCDFDADGQKDLIYAFSWGSGLHRSQIGIFNFSKDKEEWLDFVQLNKDITLEKISNDNFNIYIADVSHVADGLDLINLKLPTAEHVAEVQRINGETKIKIIKNQEG